MQDNTQNVPQWFTAFVKQNADEHGRLAAEIAANRTEIAKAEVRSTRWMIGTIIGATTLIITFLTVAMTIIVG